MRRLALVALLACDASAHREAESVAIAVERFRQADVAGKPAAAEALRAVPCSVPDICSTRDVCIAAADAWAKAIVLKEEVGRAIDRLEKGTLAKDAPEAQGLVEKLEEAQKQLDAGQARLGECDEAVTAMRRKHAR